MAKRLRFLRAQAHARGLQLPRCLARYDNSSGNFSNPDPTRVVKWGEQTHEEMLVGYLEVAHAEQDLSLHEPDVHKRDDGRYDVTFAYRPPAGVKTVYLAGEFNDWKPTGHKMDGPDQAGLYRTKIVLEKGNHEYKFVLDGTPGAGGRTPAVGVRSGSSITVSSRSAASASSRIFLSSHGCSKLS